MLALGADNDAVGPHKIGDRRPFAQEFGVGGDIEPAGGQCLLQNTLDAPSGADRHGRFRDDEGPLVAVLLQGLAELGETRPGNQPDISGPDHRYAHERGLPIPNAWVPNAWVLNAFAAIALILTGPA